MYQTFSNADEELQVDDVDQKNSTAHPVWSVSNYFASVGKFFLVVVLTLSLSMAVYHEYYNGYLEERTTGAIGTKVVDFSKATLEDINEESQNIQFTDLSETEKEQLFNLFLSTFGKSYNGSETETKFDNFKKSLYYIDERNQAEKLAGGSAVHGITKFSDLSNDEFKSQYLTSIPESERTAIPAEVVPYGGSDEVVTWVGIYTSDVKDQGYCGSCWAFSVTSQMEADGIRLGLYDLNMSLAAQQIVSCDYTSFGCAGGWTERAYQYVQSTGGVALEHDYPYTSYYDVTGQCLSDSSTYYVSIDGYYFVKNEQAMIDYVKSTGPLSVCVDASEWASYVKGVVSVCGSDVDHCVQVVAVDTSSNNGYWQVRNSWGKEWGEGGYIRLSVGDDTCAISNDPTFVEPYLLQR